MERRQPLSHNAEKQNAIGTSNLKPKPHLASKSLPWYCFPQCMFHSAKFGAESTLIFCDFHMKSIQFARKWDCSCLSRNLGTLKWYVLLWEPLSPIKILYGKMFPGWPQQLLSLASYPRIDFHRYQHGTPNHSKEDAQNAREIALLSWVDSQN